LTQTLAEKVLREILRNFRFGPCAQAKYLDDSRLTRDAASQTRSTHRDCQCRRGSFAESAKAKSVLVYKRPVQLRKLYDKTRVGQTQVKTKKTKSFEFAVDRKKQKT